VIYKTTKDFLTCGIFIICAEACSEVRSSCDCGYHSWPFHIPVDQPIQISKTFKVEQETQVVLTALFVQAGMASDAQD
jgi:hypothetical protein